LKRREVYLAPEAISDLDSIFAQIARVAFSRIADAYVTRLEDYLLGFDLEAERGTRRNDIRSGLCVVAFERRVIVAFTVKPKRVTVLRLFWGGQNWEGWLD
jgi:plasmid stabilization system protein ParE